MSSAGLFFDRRVRNPAIRHLVALGATGRDSAVPMAALVERSSLAEHNIELLVRAKWVSVTEGGLFYLDISQVKKQSLHFGMALFVILESVMVVVTVLIAFSPRVPVPMELVFAILALLTVIAATCTYFQAWPYFHLR